MFVTLSIYNTHIIYGSYGIVLGGLCSISQMMQAQEGGAGVMFAKEKRTCNKIHFEDDASLLWIY